MIRNSSRALSLAVLSMFALSFSAPVFGQTWNGSVSNSWNTAGNWTPGTVPNSSSAAVIINSSTNNPVTLGSNISVGTLTIGSAASLNMQSFQLNVDGGTLGNAGTITNADGILQLGANTTLSGGGTISLSSNPFINQSTSGVTLTNVDNTIQGNGQVGQNGLALTNQTAGIVNANISGTTLNLNGGGLVTNTGLLEASGGGFLQISNNVTNTGGNITANAGSTVNINNSATITGGTLNSASTGTFAANGTATLNDVTISSGSTYAVGGNTTLIQGTITNKGTITVANGTLQTNATTVTLTGGGKVTMSADAFLNQSASGQTLNNVNNTIQGTGQLGQNGLVLNNESGGTVNANVNGGTLNLNGGGAVANAGLLTATNGGTLQISNSVTNTGANITANGGTVAINNNATITGGTLNSTNGGTLESNGTSTWNGVTISTGTTYLVGGSQLNLQGTITNNGTINTADGTLQVNTASVTLTGGGTVTMSSDAFINQSNSGSTLNNVNNTIQGTGQLGQNGLALNNESGGTVNANVNNGTLFLNGGGTVTNAGLLTATNGGTLQISNNVTNTGANITANAGTVDINNNATITGGTLNSINGGTLGSNGTVNLNGVTISTGTTYLVGGSQLNLQGTITNNGTINTADGTLQVNTASVTLTGGGTVTMSSNAFFNQTNSGSTLNNVNNTIQGTGQLGQNGLAVNNEIGGTVNANVSAGTLFLNGGGLVTNAGLLTATNGGILQISNNVANAGGNITANGGTVAINGNATITGGTLNSINGGTLESNGTANLNGVTLSTGSTYAAGGNQLNLQGTITNRGTITAVDGTLQLNTGSLTLTGGGTVMMSSGAFFNQAASGSTLTNFNNTIEGSGQLGQNGLAIVNQAAGVINGNVNGSTLFVNGGGLLTNPGTLEASNGGTLAVSNPFDTAANGGFSSGTLTGKYIVDGSAGHLSTLQINALGTTGGEIKVLGNGTLASSITLNGANANVAFVDQAGLNALALNTVSNNATLTLLGGYVMTTPGALANAGTVHIGGSGSTLTVAPGGGNFSSYTQSAGLTQVDAGGTLAANGVGISGGTLQGTGTVTVGTEALISGGTLLPGGPGAPGTITFNGTGGNLQISDGTLTETINGSGTGQFGVTNVGGNLILGPGNSNLNIAQNASFNPPVGTALTIMNAGTPVGGTFSNIQNAVFNSSTEQWNAVYNVGGNNVILVSGVVGGGDVIATSTASGSWAATSPTNWSCAPLTAFACVPNNQTIDTVPINFKAVVSGGTNISLGVADGAQTIHNLAVNSAGTLTVNSGGSLTVTNNSTNSGTLQMNGGSIVTQNLTNYSGGTLSNGTWNMMGGTLQANNITVGTGINTIAANTNVTLGGGGTTSGFLASNGTTDALKALTSNQGNLTVTGGTTFTTTGGTLTNTGGVNIASGSLTVSGADYNQSGATATTTVSGGLNAKDYNQSGGLTTLSGGTITATDNVAITGGTLQGNGTVAATTTTISGSGILQPGTSGTPATMNVNGGLNINSGGTLAETLNGSTAGLFGFTSVGGPLNLNGGVLDILQSGTFDPNAGTAITIMTAGSPVVGNFASIQNQFFNGGTEEWVVSESGDNVILTAQNVTNSFTATWTGPSANWTTNNSNVTPWSCSPSLTPCTPNNVNGNTFSAVLNSAGNTLGLSFLSNPTTITVTSVDIQHGTLDVAGSTLNTGTLTNSDTFSTELGGRTNATILANYSGGTLSGGTWVMNGGKLEGGNISAGTGITTIAVNTTVTLNTGGSNASFLASDGTTDALKALNSNQGTLNVIGGTVFTTNGALNNSGTLSIGSASTVNVGTAGGSDYTNTASTTVSGTLNANNISDSGTTNVESGGLVSATGTYTASGTLTIFGNGTLDAGTFDQTGGTTVIDANGTLTASTVDISGGTMQVDGTLDPTAVEVTSILDGAGTIMANVTNDGTVIMGDSTSDPGKLSETGNYTQNADGTLDEAIGSSTNGELAVTGNVDLGGKLDISLLGNPTLTADELFTLMTFTGTETGTFASIIGADAGDWTVLYNSNNVELEFTPSTSAVPEPRMVVLEIALFLGLVFLYRLTRKKEKAL